MKTKKISSTKLSLMTIILLLASCAPQNSQQVDQASQAISDSLGCSDMKSLVFDSFYEMIDEQKSVPLAADLKRSLQEKLNQIKSVKNFQADEVESFDQMSTELLHVVDLMLAQSSESDITNWKEQVQLIIQYEMQSEISEEAANTQKLIHQSLNKAKALSSELSLSCNSSGSGSAPSPTPATNTQASTNAIVPLTKGLNRVIATAYQSCRVLDLPPLDKASPSVQGISIVGTHADKVGAKRSITNLAAVQSTHYYIKGIATESACFQVRNNPLIYDYGGEPAVSTNKLNFFKNAGSGTEVLGVDCSAFVSSGVALSGYRYSPGLPNKPIYTRQSAAMFINAQKSNFKCFDNVTVTSKQSILPGDIVGVKGHVVAIDRIGADPFGLTLIKTVNDCATINYKNFDIDISQSGNSKNGIGINKFKLKDYLDETLKVRTAFVEMGKQACLAKFQNKNLKPNSTEWGFVRHKGTADCLAPRVTLEGEACVQKCF